MNTSKFGARKFTEKEILNILPSYKELKKQIEEMHKSSKQYKEEYIKNKNTESKDVFGWPQVTNNISIIGPRGSGKTSIMKTLYSELKEEPKRNLVLPGIVPESMEDSMTLMSTILGLFKDKIDEIKKNEIKKELLCVPQKSEIEKNYNRLIESFGYLQKNYQEIAVNKYSTEPAHVETSTLIFSSGNEFIERFHNFINDILDTEQYSDDAMVFLFIDDIDLSTSRCMDVVRTLLSYISHPRIITILSGDMDTFEEALTVEFIRQEKLLSKDLIDTNYLQLEENTIEDIRNNRNLTLLKRKKILAYEYLKKIMPPLYRHRIIEWDLAKRSMFTNSNEENNVSMLDLLKKLGKNNLLLKNYFQLESYEENNQEYKNIYLIPQLFHIFDSTARGLNNVYNVLYDLLQFSDDEEIDYDYIKTLLETVIFSNPKLNSLREKILNNLLHFGMNKEQTTIQFENINTDFDIVEKMTSENRFLFFILFTYLDWSCRLLGKKEILISESYESAKKIALECLCLCSKISERTNEINPNILKREDSQLRKLFKFLFELDFAEAIFYYNTLDIESLLEYEKNFLNNKNNKNKSDENEVNKNNNILIIYYLKFYKVLKLISERKTLNSQEFYDLTKYIQKDKDIFNEIQNIFQKDEYTTLLKSLFGDYYINIKDNTLFKIYTEFKFYNIQEILNPYNCNNYKSNYDDSFVYSCDKCDAKSCNKGNCNNDLCKKIRIYLDINYNEKLKNYISKHKENETIPFYNFLYNEYFIELIDELYKLKSISDFDLSKEISFGNGSEQDKNRFKIISAIDESNFWGESLNKDVIGYVEKQWKLKQKNLYSYFKNGTSDICYIDFKELYDYVHIIFKNIEKGDSNTVSKQCYNLLDKILKERGDLEEYVLIKQIIKRLAYSTAWYGVKEAWEMLDIMDRIELKFEDKDKMILKNLEENRFWMHCLGRIRFQSLEPELTKALPEIKNLLNDIKLSVIHSNDISIEEYKNTLSQYIDKDLIDEIPNLFNV